MSCYYPSKTLILKITRALNWLPKEGKRVRPKKYWNLIMSVPYEKPVVKPDPNIPFSGIIPILERIVKSKVDREK